MIYRITLVTALFFLIYAYKIHMGIIYTLLLATAPIWHKVRLPACEKLLQSTKRFDSAQLVLDYYKTRRDLPVIWES